MDLKVKGIVLKAKDYKDSDKLVTILTLEKGKILVKARGIKKPSSKLKAFCQSFCFADFELVESHDSFVLTGANGIENFFELTSNIEKFSYAFCVIEILDKICKENQTYPKLFVESLKCLKQMNYKNTNPKLVMSKFFIDLLDYEGFNLNLTRCTSCKTPLVSKIFLDTGTGEILCPVCKTFESIELEKAVFSSLKIIADNEYEKLDSIKLKDNVLDKTLKVLVSNVTRKFEIKLNSLML